ncbi:TPA: phage tail spike protein [Clostridium perfringens]|uniref:phage tail spike protein n=1 Tax=Clostridium perfringens TaxID=1502 RepID=UPI001CCCD6A0|nr:phage tail spike protein [Clostridium perfringens]UBK45563.1 peptidoglycan DD-metalloendopeptidase family protein [Clostridium perfringens]UBK54378.1 peptidoglycan DD-metalloendopeptidase family protein [Clostridium perfringens]UBK83511.1 peptidoglycan DD-metalloendopeptidase family protein [Clostridium perfringens]
MVDGKIRIAIFPQNTPRDTVLSSNGYSLDNWCTLANGFKDLAGNFRFEGNFINDKKRPEIEKGYILKVLDEYGRDEIFRITTCNKNTMITSIIAFQITITETQSLWLDDVRPTECSGTSSIQYILDGANSFGFPKEIFVSSNISNTSTAYYQKMSMFNALHNCDQSFKNRWGGEVLRHQYNLTINDKIGQDNGGVIIREGKNLLGFKANTNIDSLATVLIGKGFDGITGDYIESPIKNKYPRAFIKVIEYSDIKVRNESDSNDEGFATLEEAQREINKRIKEEFSEKHVDEVKAQYDIDFIQLEQTQEFKEYASLQILDVGDIARVYVDSLDLKLTTRVVEKHINYLNGTVLKTVLSNNPVQVIKSDSQVISEIRNTFVKNNNSNLGDFINSMMRQGLKNSFVINKENETYWLDNKDPNLAKNVVRINKNGLACSTTGINGKFEYGITIDGKINASLIVTGILSTILITNADNSFEIDLSGTGGASFKNNGKMAMRLENNMVKLYNWAKNGDYIGGLMSLCNNSDPDKPIIALGNDLNSCCMITYPKEGTLTHPAYVSFDKFNILKDKNGKPIRVYEDVDFRGNKVYNIDIRSDNGNSNIMVGDHFINITTPNNEIVVSDRGVRIGKQISRSLFYDANTGEITINAPIKNANGQIILDPNNFGIGGGGIDNLGNVSKGIPSKKYFRYVKGIEGLQQYPGNIGDGEITYGYGVTKSNEPTYFAKLGAAPCSEETASKVLFELIPDKYGSLVKNQMLKDGVDLNKVPINVFDAFVDLTYNSGRYNSSLYRDWVNGVSPKIIYNKWLSYITMPGSIFEDGLKRRRKEEAEMFLNANYMMSSISILNAHGGQIGTVKGDGYFPSIASNFKTVNNDYGNWILPVSGSVTALFGKYPSGAAKHTGTDIGCPEGTPVHAARDGVVIKRRELTYSYGKYLFVDHGGGLVTIYGHNSKLLVNEGDHVKQGQVIALSGSTGNSSGNHSHIELRYNGTPVDFAPSLRIGQVV